MDTYIDDIKQAVGRPNDKWEFIFSPAGFDDNIDTSQFQAKPLDLKEMRDYGAQASGIRKALLQRALSTYDDCEEISPEDSLKKDKISKRLHRHIEGGKTQMRIDSN